jgi:hypothetical protein
MNLACGPIIGEHLNADMLKKKAEPKMTLPLEVKGNK